MHVPCVQVHDQTTHFIFDDGPTFGAAEVVWLSSDNHHRAREILAAIAAVVRIRRKLARLCEKVQWCGSSLIVRLIARWGATSVDVRMIVDGYAKDAF